MILVLGVYRAVQDFLHPQQAESISKWYIFVAPWKVASYPPVFDKCRSKGRDLTSPASSYNKPLHPHLPNYDHSPYNTMIRGTFVVSGMGKVAGA